jgi:hypothetical protein
VSAWDPGDRVEIDSESHCYHGETGTVRGPDDLDEGTWTVRLDGGEDVEVYAHEITGTSAPPPATTLEDQ